MYLEKKRVVSWRRPSETDLDKSRVQMSRFGQEKFIFVGNMQYKPNDIFLMKAKPTSFCECSISLCKHVSKRKIIYKIKKAYMN